MASASLPGVFEANRLMVKDADGTERYESTSGTPLHFQDGSMEADLPMQQLSEMFNINHFIISQANPHAVMFGSYNLERSVWAHPIVGYINGMLLFLKNQVCPGRCQFFFIRDCFLIVPSSLGTSIADWLPAQCV